MLKGGELVVRIYIKTNEGRVLRFPAPLWLVSGALGFGKFGVKIAKRHVPEDQKQYLEIVDFHELRKGFKILREYKGLTLVEVRSSDGTEVTIVV